MIEKNREYDFFEVWLDYIEDLDEAFVTELKNAYDGKLVFLFRRQNLETIKMDFAMRKKIILHLQHSKCYVDLDITTQKDELDFIEEEEIDVWKIVSYHNYKETPKADKLDEIIKDMLEYNPIVVKVTTFCNRETDALRLMILMLDLKVEKIRFIVLGMGEYGQISRIYGAMQGNAMNFAPRNLHEKSAPGQLTKSELEDISKILG